MNKGQVSFAFAGLLFGFLVGFVVAHQIYSDPGGVPAAGAAQAGMAGGGSAGPRGASPPPGMGGPGQSPEQTMEAVTREIEALKALLQDEPDNLAARVRLANLFFDAGMFEGAATHYQKALELEPGDINVLTDLGTAHRNLGQPQAALQRFEEAVQLAPDHWRGWFNIGIVTLYDTGDFDRARLAFDKVAELKPGTVDMNALQTEIDRVRAEKAAGGGA